MSAKPLRNSKGVDKPFRSPFSNLQKTESNSNKSSPVNSQTNSCNTPLRVSVTKRLLFRESPPAKKLCVHDEGCTENNSGPDEKLCISDLDALKKRIQKKQEDINILKTTLQYRKKNKAEDLKADIEKWTSVCQDALQDYQSDLQEKCGNSLTMVEILSSFGIDENLVRYSNSDNTFY